MAPAAGTTTAHAAASFSAPAWPLDAGVVGSGVVRRDGLPGLHRLAAGIDRDCDAVVAGLTLPGNSGVVEGHIAWITKPKRRMVGRAGSALLRQRVLLVR